MEEERINDMPQPDVPYIVHESAMARLERVNRRLWITVFVCLAIIAGMFVYEIQFVDESWSFESTTVRQLYRQAAINEGSLLRWQGAFFDNKTDNRICPKLPFYALNCPRQRTKNDPESRTN